MNYADIQHLIEAGLHLFPCRATKEPCCHWKSPYAWREDETCEAVGMATGSLSGNVEVIDIDNGNLFESLPKVDAVVARTVSGGYHLIYRTPEPGPNTKLAMSYQRVYGPGEYGFDWRPGKKYQAKEYADGWYVTACAIETRGENGFIVAAPSPGYELISGSLTDIPTLTTNERDRLFFFCQALGEHPPTPKAISRKPSAGATGTRPGDAFNAKVTVDDLTCLLVKHGWVHTGDHGNNRHFARPGKATGTSATLGGSGDYVLFYVFSSSAAPFEAEKAYTPFQVLAKLEHGDDYSAAALSLARCGYGEKETDPTPKKKLFIRVGEIEIKPIQWVVEDTIETDSLFVIFGETGSYKSFFAIDIACCVASGHDFHGKKTKTTGPVLYICGEGRNGIARRIAAWCIRNEVAISGLPLFVSTRPVGLSEPDQVEWLISEIADMGVVPALVVIDTLARNFGTGDENSTRDMSAFVDGADAVRQIYRTTTGIVHHTGLTNTDRSRGNGALKNGVDAEYRMDADDAGTVTVTCLKMKEAEKPLPVAYEVDIVELGILDERGEAVTSCVLTGGDVATSTTKKRKGRWQIVATEEIEKSTIEAWRRDGPEGVVTVDEFRRLCSDRGMAQKTISRNLTSMQSDGEIWVDHDEIYLSII